MMYRIYRKSTETPVYTEPFNRCKMPYLTAKQMDERYPDGAFTIIGEIGCFAKPCAGQDSLMVDVKNEIPVFPRGSLFPPLEWVAGYVQVGEAVYIAAIRSLIPSFSRRWRRSRRTRPEGNIHHNRGEKL